MIEHSDTLKAIKDRFEKTEKQDKEMILKKCSDHLEKKGLKYDQGKLRWDLLPLDVIEEVVKVYTFGATKYKPNSWQDLEDGKERYYAALMRHIATWRSGEKYDEESNIYHLAHAMWNVIALIYFDKKEEENVTSK